jgi:hypothetical protein
MIAPQVVAWLHHLRMWRRESWYWPGCVPLILIGGSFVKLPIAHSTLKMGRGSCHRSQNPQEGSYC